MSNDGILHISNLEFNNENTNLQRKLLIFKTPFYLRHDSQPTSKDKSAYISYLHSRKLNGI